MTPRERAEKMAEVIDKRIPCAARALRGWLSAQISEAEKEAFATAKRKAVEIVRDDLTTGEIQWCTRVTCIAERIEGMGINK